MAKKGRRAKPDQEANGAALTDERRREMENLFKKGGHGLCYDENRAAGRECLRIIDCLREVNERLKESQSAGWDSAIEHHEAEVATYKEENAKLRKVDEGRGRIEKNGSPPTDRAKPEPSPPPPKTDREGTLSKPTGELESENAKLRKVVGAAQEYKTAWCSNKESCGRHHVEVVSGERAALFEALRELDEEKKE